MKKNWYDIYRIQSESSNSSKMEWEILKQLKKINHLKVMVDDYGNILVTKFWADYMPLFVCHIDTVHQITVNSPLIVVEDNEKIIGTDKDGKPKGIGGDDKNGIITMLELLKWSRVPIKVAFFKDEEIGCVGSSNMNEVFMKNVSYIIGVDRQGNSDILTGGHWGNTVTAYFKSKLSELGATFGYKIEDRTTVTDSSNLSEIYDIASVNISCGYYKPHSDLEYIVKKDLENAIEFCKEIILNMDSTIQHKLEPKKKYSFNAYSYYEDIKPEELMDVTFVDEVEKLDSEDAYLEIEEIAWDTGVYNLYELINRHEFLDDLLVELELQCYSDIVIAEVGKRLKERGIYNN